MTLGIYKHYWYKSWITFVGLIVLFEVIKKWHKLIFNTSSPVIRYFTTMLGVLALYLPTTNWIGILSGYFQIKKDILIDPFISHAIIAMPKYLILINMVYLLIVKKASWIWNLAVILLVFSSDMILYYTKLMYIKDGWLPIYSGISLFTAYLYIHTMNKLLYGDRSYRS